MVGVWRRVVVVALLAHAAAAQRSEQCPTTGQGAQAPSALTNCPCYSDSACCTATNEERLDTSADGALAIAFRSPYSDGYNDCVGLINMLMCSYTCAPNQAEFVIPGAAVTADPDGPGGYAFDNSATYVANLTVRICEHFCSVLYSECRSSLLIGGETVESQYSREEFCVYLSSDTAKAQPFITYTLSDLVCDGYSTFTPCGPFLQLQVVPEGSADVCWGSREDVSGAMQCLGPTHSEFNQTVDPGTSAPGGGEDDGSGGSDTRSSADVLSVPALAVGAVVFAALVGGAMLVLCATGANGTRPRMDESVNNAVAWVGGACAKRPATTIAAWVVVGAVAAATLAADPPEFEADPLKLWAPRSSSYVDEKDDFEASFGGFYRTAAFIVRTKGSASLPITASRLLTHLDIEREVRAIEAEYEGAVYTLDDLCLRPVDEIECVVSTPLDYFNYRNGPSHDVEQNIRLNNCDGPLLNGTGVCEGLNGNACTGTSEYSYAGYCCLDAGYSVSLSSAKTVIGNGIRGENVVGDPTLVANPYCAEDDDVVGSSPALMTTFLLDPTNRGAPKGAAKAWEARFLDVLARMAAELESSSSDSGVEVEFYAERAVEDELDQANHGSAGLVVAGYVAMLVLVALVLSDRTSVVRCRSLLSLACVLCIAGSVVIALAFCHWIGVQFGPLTAQVLPFLSISLGVNDLFFVVLHGVDLTPGNLVPAERVREGIRRVGGGVLTTSLCNFFSFVVAAFSVMPVVEALSVQAAVVVLVMFVTQVTVVSAFIALDLRRIAAGRADVAVWVRRRGGSQAASVASGSVAVVEGALQRTVCRLVSSSRARLATIAAFAVAVGVSVWAVATHAHLGLEPSDSLPKDSFVIGFLDSLERDFSQVGPPVYVVTGEFDYSALDVQVGVENLETVLRDSKWIESAVINWMADFHVWASVLREGYFAEMILYKGDHVIPPDRFYPWLVEYMNTTCEENADGGFEPCGSAKRIDIKGADTANATNKLTRTRMVTQFVGLQTTDDLVDAMTELRDDVRDYARDYGSPLPAMYVYSPYFVYYEQYLVIADEVVRNVAVALVVVFFVTLVLGTPFPGTGNLTPAAAALNSSLVAALMPGMVCTALAIIFAVGVHVNGISVVNVVVSMGLLLEFLVHTARAFGQMHTGSSPDTAASAVKRVGPAVWFGGLSTVVGVAPLAFSDFTVLRVYYFATFSVVVLVGVLFGLVLMPAVLAGTDLPAVPQKNQTVPSPAPKNVELHEVAL